ncbi:MAG: hypothetical protein K1Y36_08530 [Blastocatellia bacterium]|nr:hypothetical protein [Blastocatellia bacterium]
MLHPTEKITLFPACRKRNAEAEFSGGEVTRNGNMRLVREATRCNFGVLN